ncbi:MAG: hypothetical protein JNL88_07000 [Bacteroidia bacterium]|nr:hypothetical protein [Bacteroidia bacterium]
MPYHVGLTVSFGAGLSYWKTGLFTEKNQELQISPGGGIGLGLMLNAPLQGNWLLGNEFNYQFTSFTPQAENVEGHFTHLNYLISLKHAFQFKEDPLAIVVGAGLDLSINGKYDFDARKLPDGAHNLYNYKTSLGPSVHVEYLAWFDRNSLGGLIGLRYTYMKYHLDQLSSNGQDVALTEEIKSSLPSKLLTPDGSGIDLYVSLMYSF